ANRRDAARRAGGCHNRHLASRRSHSPRSRPRLMFSLHIDTARTWRGGQNQVLLTVNGLRAIGQRAALVAHPGGELLKRVAEGLELVPLAARTEMDLSAAWKLARVIKRLGPDILHAHDAHATAMASLALSLTPNKGTGVGSNSDRLTSP